MSMTTLPWAPDEPRPPARERARGWVTRRRITAAWVTVVVATFVIACVLDGAVAR